MNDQNLQAHRRPCHRAASFRQPKYLRSRCLNEAGGTTKVQHTDRLGTNKLHTDASATTVGTQDFDAFGQLVSTSGTLKNNLGFAGGFGYQEDDETSLKLLGHRLYDPSIGRFLERDHGKEGFNWYGYVDNNPIKAIDSDGLKKKLVIILGDTHGVNNYMGYLLSGIYDKFGDEYEITVVRCKTKEDVENALVGADAAVMIGHGAPFAVPKGHAFGIEDIAKVARRRKANGKSKLEFLLLYSCDLLQNEADREAYLSISQWIFGFEDLNHLLDKKDNIWNNGRFWNNPKHPYKIGGGLHGSPISTVPGQFGGSL